MVSNPVSNLPPGIIAMWHGLLADIPTGWLLCDGSSGTPDLRAKFVEGAAIGIDPGATGGNVSHTHSITRFNEVRGTGEQSHPHSPTATGSSDGRPPYYDVAFIMST